MAECIQIKGDILKSLQQTELKILKDIVKFCDKNKIRYCLSSGTLLGAVRHQGFIPWDDDVDISMPRQDFERFLSLADQLPEPYICQATRFDPNYPSPIVKVRKKGTIMREPIYKDLNIEHGVWVDIFPLDRVSSVEKLRKRAHEIGLLTTAIGYKIGVYRPYKLRTRIVCFLLGLLGVKKMDEWRTKVMRADEKKNSNKLTNFASNLGYRNLLFDDLVYFPLKKLRFEDEEFYVPADWDKWLTSAYGDYMTLPPKEQQVNRHKISELRL